VVRNEENLAEKTTVSFYVCQVIGALLHAFSIDFYLQSFFIQDVTGKWFDPKYEQAAQKKQLIHLAQRLDSLAVEEDRKKNSFKIFSAFFGRYLERVC